MSDLLRGTVVDGKLILELPDEVEDGTSFTVRVLRRSDQCPWTFVPGILNPPGNTMPRVRTRCSFKVGHGGDCSYGPRSSGLVGPDVPNWDEDDSESDSS